MIDLSSKSKKKIFKQLKNKIKGYKGYSNLNRKKETNKRIKNYFIDKFEQFKDKITRLQSIALQSQMVIIWGDIDNIMGHINKTIIMLENTKYRGSSFFLTNTIRDVEIDLMIQDLNAILIIKKLGKKFSELSDSVDTALLSTIPDTTAQIIDSIEVFQSTWESRKKIIKKFSYI